MKIHDVFLAICMGKPARCSALSASRNTNITHYFSRGKQRNAVKFLSAHTTAKTQSFWILTPPFRQIFTAWVLTVCPATSTTKLQQKVSVLDLSPLLYQQLHLLSFLTGKQFTGWWRILIRRMHRFQILLICTKNVPIWINESHPFAVAIESP